MVLIGVFCINRQSRINNYKQTNHWNGLLRRFFPKGMKIGGLSRHKIDEAQYLINIRPRKALNYFNPIECYRASVCHLRWQSRLFIRSGVNSTGGYSEGEHIWCPWSLNHCDTASSLVFEHACSSGLVSAVLEAVTEYGLVSLECSCCLFSVLFLLLAASGLSVSCGGGDIEPWLFCFWMLRSLYFLMYSHFGENWLCRV